VENSLPGMCVNALQYGCPAKVISWHQDVNDVACARKRPDVNYFFFPKMEPTSAVM
jgi:hypothetical protein